MKILLAHKWMVRKMADPQVGFSIHIHKPHLCPNQRHLDRHPHRPPQFSDGFMRKDIASIKKGYLNDHAIDESLKVKD